MKASAFALLGLLVLAGCVPKDAPALLRIAERTVNPDTLGLEAAAAVLDSALTRRDGSLYCGRDDRDWGDRTPVKADSLRALLCNRLGYVRFRQGDMEGALTAYRQTARFVHLLPDTLGPEALRSMAYVAGETGDDAQAMLLLDEAERSARNMGANPPRGVDRERWARMMNGVAARINECKAALLSQSGDPRPCAEPTLKRRGTAGLLVLFGVALLCVAVIVVGRRQVAAHRVSG